MKKDNKRAFWKRHHSSSHAAHSLPRRSFLNMVGASLILPTAFTGMSRSAKANEIEANRYDGSYWILIHAGGGWDPTLICDPKGYSSEDDPAPVNHYHVEDITEVGPFLVPPVDGMEEFFTTFQNDLLVINGIDMGTNGHEQGTRATWSGNTEANRPSFGALLAATRENTPSLGFISNGGYDTTGGFIPVTRLPDPSTLSELAFPNLRDTRYDDSFYLHPEINDRIVQARKDRIARLQGQARLPRTLNAMQVLEAVRSDDSELQALVEVLPTNLRSADLEKQVQIAMSCFSAGVSVCANLSIGGFDTHGNHDNNHTPRLQQIVQAVTYAREEAERLGIADKVNIVVGSDFARTPYYNDGNGKDHWSISSMFMLGADIPGGRVIGGTDADQLPLAVNPTTLALDSNGIVITPAHIHAALRRLTGMEGHPFTTATDVGEWIPLFT